MRYLGLVFLVMLVSTVANGSSNSDYLDSMLEQKLLADRQATHPRDTSESTRRKDKIYAKTLVKRNYQNDPELIREKAQERERLEKQELEIKEHQWLSDEVRYSLNQIFGGVVILGICTGFIPIMLFALAIWLLKGTWKGSVFIGKKIIEEGSPPKDTPPKLTRMVDEFEKKYSSRD